MIEARIYVDFSEMIEDNLVLLSKSDTVIDSQGNTIKLKEGLKVKLYSDDLSGCTEKDNLIADGVVVLNTNNMWMQDAKWNCRLNVHGIYNESQETKK